jgi:hypothetical protein
VGKLHNDGPSTDYGCIRHTIAHAHRIGRADATVAMLPAPQSDRRMYTFVSCVNSVISVMYQVNKVLLKQSFIKPVKTPPWVGFLNG